MTAPQTIQPAMKKLHLPAVGIIGLVLIAAAAGGIAYTQFLHPPSTVCQVIPAHRLYVMQAIIHEDGGFNIHSAYKLNSTASTLPKFNSTYGPVLPNSNTTQVPNPSDKSLISGNVGDIITLYIHPVSTNESVVQQQGLTGHGFAFDSTSFFSITNSTIPSSGLISFGNWYTISLQITGQGQTKYRCTQVCSTEHPQMNGSISVGCGG